MQITSKVVRSITDYYAALNELAAMLQDREITYDDWTIQSVMLHWSYNSQTF